MNFKEQKNKDLFDQIKLGKLTLNNRIVMPPMTRSRSSKGDVANDIMATYYAQRASAGLIVSEGTQISQQGQGYAWTPGIYNQQQINGWKRVTRAVHEAGGVIFAQLWHVGRISHRSLQPGGTDPVSSSELIAEDVKVYIDPKGKGPKSRVGEMIQHSKPRALTVDEIKDIVQDYARAARNAIKAGFDGVELHAANGYLINQFIDSQANARTDEYGGSLENRLRFLKEVTEVVTIAIGKDKVGVRLAPLTTLQGTVDDNPQETYIAAVELLNDFGIAYIHIAEADWDDSPEMPISFKRELRKAFHGIMIYSGKYDRARAEKALKEGWSDMIGFGRAFIANPDLPYRMANNLALNEPRSEFYFGGAEEGYTDYPVSIAKKISIPQRFTKQESDKTTGKKLG